MFTKVDINKIDRNLADAASDDSVKNLIIVLFALTSVTVASPLLPTIQFFSSPAGYAPLHTAFEVFSICVSLMVSMLVWSTRKQGHNCRRIFLGSCFLAVAIIDLAHTLSFVGMPDFINENFYGKAISLWLAARLICAIGLLGAIFMPRTKLSNTACAFMMAAGLLLASAVTFTILQNPPWLPRTFIPGEGLTSFKIVSEYALTLMFAAAAFLFARRGWHDKNKGALLLAGGAWIHGLAEIYFTQYVVASDSFNIIGHSYKIIAYYMIYKAIYVRDVQAPYRNLAKERATLRALLATLPDPVWLKNPNGVYLSCNSAFEKLVGHSESEIIGKIDSDLFSEPSARQFRAYDHLALSQSGPSVNEEFVDTADKGKRLFETTKTAMRLRDGTPVGVLGIAHDITERRDIERQLRHSQKMEAIGQLTGGIAHDFNNLLSVIVGNADVALESKSLDDDAREALQVIMEASMRGAETTKRLLTYARKQSLNPSVVDIADLIGNQVRLMRRTLEETIEITTRFGASLWRARVDPGQLQDAILNLAINSRDAMPNGGRLEISAENWQTDGESNDPPPNCKPGEYVKIVVKDDGTGMSAELRERVLEPFFTTKDVGKGSGLGLSMVYGFVAQSNGYLQIDSALGQGTAINIYLPRAISGDADLGLSSRTDLRAPHGTTDIAILLVEDEPAVRQIVRMNIERLGYRCIVAENGPAALDCLRAEARIDLLLTDIVMPGGMNGVQLIEEAQQLKPDLKAVCMSGYSHEALLRTSNLPEQVAILSKPFKNAALAETIRLSLR